MARPLRIQFEDALYHVTARGNEKRPIYLDDEDRYMFIKLLKRMVEQYRWIIYAYCLMDNHYHLLVRTQKANLSKGMRQLNGIYAQYFNRRHERVGHLFQGRFADILIMDEDRLLVVARYVVLNPVRAGLVANPEDWRWSSYLGTAGIINPPSFIDADQILRFFSKQRASAAQQYVDFVRQGIGTDSPISDAKGGIIYKDEKPIEVSTARLLGEISDEVPRRERFADRPMLEEIFECGDRDIGIYRAFYKYEYRLKEIGDFLGVHYSLVSKVARRIEED